MFMYATVDQITGSMRSAILFFIAFFLLGAILLIRLERMNKQAL
jgi:UMF1 family MFS transporter